MYVRIARFEGVDTASLDADMARFREIVRMESMPNGMPEETFARLRESVKHVVSVADRAGATTMDLIYTETEEEARWVHEVLDAMSPPDSAGRRTSVGIFEVMVDEKPA